MKSKPVKLFVIALGLSGCITLNSFAQTSNPSTPTTTTPAKPPAQKTPAAAPAKPATASKDATKEEYTKHLNEIQPKVAEFNSKAQQNASKNPEFATEANKLNSMVGEFKTKLARWDNVPESQHEQFSQELKKSWDSVNTQYKKVDGMSKKMNPSTGEMNKKTPAPQPAPSSK